MNRKSLYLFVMFLFFVGLIMASTAAHKENFEEGKKAYKNKQYSEALKLFRLAAAEKPDKAKYHYNLGLAARKLKYYDEAYNAFMKAKELDPGIGFTNKRDEFFKKLAETRSKAGKVEQQPAAAALSHKESFESGKQAYKNKQYHQAYDYFKSAIAQEPGVAKYNYNLGLAAMKLKYYEEAYKAFLRAQELDPGIEFTNKRDEFRIKLEEARYQVDIKDKQPAAATVEKEKKKKGGLPVLPIVIIGGIILFFLIGRARKKRRMAAAPGAAGEDLLESGRSRVISSTQYVHGRRPRFWKRRKKYRDDSYDDQRFYDDHTRDHGYRPDTGDYVSRRDES